MKPTTSLNFISALALVTVLAAPAFAEQSTPVTTTGSGQTVTTTTQTLTPLPKKWWTEN